MKHTQVGKSWYVGLVIIITLGISIACVGSGVKPDDPRLQPPISNIGIRFEDFLKQLSLVPSGGIMAPWVTQPPDYLYEAESQLEISGWAPNFPIFCELKIKCKKLVAIITSCEFPFPH